MMQEISISEYDLVEFFGSLHISRAFGTDWYDSDSVYEHKQRDGISIQCAVHPIHKDARITLSQGGHVLCDWQATALADISFDRTNTRLEFRTPTGDVLSLTLLPKIVVAIPCAYRDK